MKKEVNKSVVIGTIGEDAHMIGAWVLSETYKDGEHLRPERHLLRRSADEGDPGSEGKHRLRAVHSYFAGI